HAEEDKKRKEVVEARNQADSLIHTTEKNLKEFGDKVGEDERKEIEDATQALREVMDGDDVQAIRSKIEALAAASMKLGEAMYKASQEAPAESGEEASESAAKADGEDATVVDADFEEVEDEKRDKPA
ncbi:MAG: Hsp70 family protein, partial [Alphaproteobacteria bacterium]